MFTYVQYVIKKVLHHSYIVLCKSCHRNVHRNCTQFSHTEFQLIETNTPWYCRLFNENIFAFNHIESESEFVWTLRQFMNTSLYLDALDRHQDSEIFDPFESNDDDNDNIIEYRGELDPDKNYFNQLAHHLSKSSNYHIEVSINKYIIRIMLTWITFTPPQQYQKHPSKPKYPFIIYE